MIRNCALTEVRINTPSSPSGLRLSYRKKASLLWAGSSALVHFNITFLFLVLVTNRPEVTLDRPQILLV